MKFTLVNGKANVAIAKIATAEIAGFWPLSHCQVMISKVVSLGHTGLRSPFVLMNPVKTNMKDNVVLCAASSDI